MQAQNSSGCKVLLNDKCDPALTQELPGGTLSIF